MPSSACKKNGNLGNDPEVKSTTRGNRVATFSLATSRAWNDAAGAKQEKTEWHRCVAWNSKGQQLAHVVGDLAGELPLDAVVGSDGQSVVERLWSSQIVGS